MKPTSPIRQIAAALLLMTLVLAVPLSAATITWTNTAGGDWNAATNWSPNLIPTSGDTAVINDSAAYTISVSGFQQFGGLVMGNANAKVGVLPGANFYSGSGLENHGTIELGTAGAGAQATFYVTGVLTNAPGGIIRVLGNGAISAGLDNQGVFEISGTATLATTLGDKHRTSGEVNITTNAQLKVNSGDWLQTSEGQMNIAEGAVFELGGSSSAWTHQGGQITGEGTIKTSTTISLNLEADFSVATVAFDIWGFGLVVNGPGRLVMTAGPALSLQGWRIYADLELDRNLRMYDTWIYGKFSVPAGRTVHIGNTNTTGGGGARLIVAHGFENHGTIELGNDAGENGGGLFVTSGILTNAVGGMIRVIHGMNTAAEISAELDNRGTLEMARDVQLKKDFGSIQRNSGLIEVLGGKLAVYNFYGGNSLLNEGEIRVLAGAIFEPSGGSLSNTVSGLFSGTGEFRLEGVGTIVNNGTVAPGLSPGTLGVTGKYAQAAGGILDLEVGGFTSGTEHDVLAITETSPGAGAAANLNGIVRATLINGFSPKKDDAFTVLTYLSRVGEFANVESAEPERIAWKIEYGPTNAQLVALNTSPTLATITNQTVNEQTQLSLTVMATDQDLPAQTLTYSLETAPTGVTINPTSGQITWTPTEAQGPGVFNVTVRVTDNGTPALGHTTSFSVTVNEVNVAPQLVLPGAQTVNEQVELVFTINATDVDVPANALSYELVSAPPSATFNATTREFRWTATEAQGPGNFTATFRVTDNNPDAVNTQQLSTTGDVSIAVTEVNRVPLLTVPGKQSVDEGTLFSATATATDADLPANLLTYSLMAPPAGMTINPGSGAISWTPTEAQGLFTNTITVVVTDTNPPAGNATSLSVTSSFTLTVNEVNLAPTLLVPANRTIHAGTALTVSALVTDPDLPANTFSYSKLSGPAGMNVSGAGLITWNSGDADANTTNMIVLRVNDNGVPNLSDTNSFVVTVNSRPVFTSITKTASVATAVWTAIPGAGYRLQHKTNLDAASWSDVAGDVTAGGITASKSDATLGTNAARFYQVFVLP